MTQIFYWNGPLPCLEMSIGSKTSEIGENFDKLWNFFEITSALERWMFENGAGLRKVHIHSVADSTKRFYSTSFYSLCYSSSDWPTDTRLTNQNRLHFCALSCGLANQVKGNFNMLANQCDQMWQNFPTLVNVPCLWHFLGG